MPIVRNIDSINGWDKQLDEKNNKPISQEIALELKEKYPLKVTLDKIKTEPEAIVNISEDEYNAFKLHIVDIVKQWLNHSTIEISTNHRWIIKIWPNWENKPNFNINLEKGIVYETYHYGQPLIYPINSDATKYVISWSGSLDDYMKFQEQKVIRKQEEAEDK